MIQIKVIMACCRICYEDDKISNLLTPCYCKGTMKYVHQECLLTWMKMSQKNKCEMCKYKFEVVKSYRSPLMSYLEEEWVLSSLSIIIILLVVILIGHISHKVMFRMRKRKYYNLPTFQRNFRMIIDSIRSSTLILTFGCVWGSSLGLFDDILEGETEIDLYTSIYRIVFHKLKTKLQNYAIQDFQIKNLQNYEDDCYYPYKIKESIRSTAVLNNLKTNF